MLGQYWCVGAHTARFCFSGGARVLVLWVRDCENANSISHLFIYKQVPAAFFCISEYVVDVLEGLTR